MIQSDEQSSNIEIKQETSVHQIVAAARRDLERDEAEEEELIRRREKHLIRRPSYRKILTDLGGHHNMLPEDRADREASGSESGGSEEILNQDRLSGLSERLSGISDRHHHHLASHHIQQPLRVVPSGSLLSNGSGLGPNEGPGGMTNSSLLQYSPASENGGYYLPGNHLGGGLGGPGLTGGGGPGGHDGHHQDESTRKREIRLMKNREAARECRRKKKEYIKCLENRVAVLENQNKALIEELKSLKELYTGGKLL